MSLFKSVDLIRRSTPGTYEKGQWVKGTPVETNFKGTAQPASGKTLELLPEGKRNSETITIYAPISMDFSTAEPRDQKTGDIIVWENRNYEVQIARKWNNGILPHWELVAIRIKEGEQ
jgi:hypothetical protein